MAKSRSGRPRKKRRPPSKLATWQKATKTSVISAAEQLGISGSSVYALRERTLIPGRDLAVRIEDLTGIPIRYWKKKKS